MTQHGKGGARFSNPSGDTDSVIATGTRLSRLELAVANLEEKVKTLEMTVKDIRWGEKEAAEQEDHPTIEEERT
jgi:hypothetical protein